LTNSHQQRVWVLNEILRTCHERHWDYDTSDLAGKISIIATRMGFNPNTVKNLTYSAVTLLKLEKDTGITAATEQEPLKRVAAEA
jgi:hypothetical protein